MAAGEVAPEAQLYEHLYRTVLGHWRRSHSEVEALRAVVHEVEAAARESRRAAAHRALFRVVRRQDDAALQRALRAWAVASLRLSASSALDSAHAQLRRERASLKEVEAQLVLAQEAEQAAQSMERAVRAQWTSDRLLAQRQEEEELAMVEEAVGVGGGADGLSGSFAVKLAAAEAPTRPPAAEPSFGHRAAAPAPTAAPSTAATSTPLTRPVVPTARRQRLRQEDDEQEQGQPPPPPHPPPTPQEQPPPISEARLPMASAPRPLGSRAEQLLLAYRRESGASRHADANLERMAAVRWGA